MGTGKPYVYVSLGGTEIYGLLDSGCSPVLIDSKVVARIFPDGNIPIEDCKVNLVGAGGAILGVKGSIKLDINISNRDHSFDCIVCDELKEDIILGFSFLQSIQATLDTGQLKLFTPYITADLLQSNSKLVAAVAVNKDTVYLEPFSSHLINVLVPTKNNALRGLASVVCRSRSDKLSCDQTVHNINYDQPSLSVTNLTGEGLTLRPGTLVAEILPIIEVSSIMSEVPGPQDLWDPTRIAKLQDQIEVGDEAADEWNQKFRDTISKFPDVFSLSDDEPRDTPYFSFKIKLLNDIPVTVRPFAQPIHLREKINEEVDRLIANKVIEPSMSNFNSRAFFIPKKSGGDLRCIVDFRKVNAVIQKVPCVIPNIREAIKLWHGCTHFIVADLSSSFFQLGIDEMCRHITAFEILGRGKFHFRRVPLGLNNSPGNLMQVMWIVIDGMHGFILVFVDDIIIAGLNPGHLLEVWTELLRRLRKYRLTLRPDKTKLYKKRVFALGHWLSAECGIEPNRDKIKSLMEMGYPRTLKQVRSFLGAVAYFEIHIPGQQHAARGLINDTKVNKANFKLTEEGRKSFDNLKIALSEATDLAFPDPHSPFILQVDSSDHTYASALVQMREGGPVPIGFNSKRIPDTDRKKHINIKEFLSLHHAIVKRWPQYLKGQRFTVETDNKTIMSPHFLSKVDNARLQRCIADLSLYDFDMVYVPSIKNFIADSLTRFDTEPQESLGMTDLFKEDSVDELTNDVPVTIEQHEDVYAVVTRRQAALETIIEELEDEAQDLSRHMNEGDDNPAEELEGLDNLEAEQASRSEVTRANDTNNEQEMTEADARTEEQPEMERVFIENFPEETQALEKLLATHATSAELAKLQDEDHDLAYVKKRIKEGAIPNERDKHMSKGQWYHLQNSSMYSVDENDCLVRQYIENYTGINRSLIVVPDALQPELIREAHTGALSGHFGRDRTLGLLRKYFFFQNMYKQVGLLIACCSQCQRFNHEYSKKPRAPLQPYAAKAVGQIVHVDCAGPFARNSSGYKYYVVVVDKFSGFCQARALKSLTASAVVDILIQQWMPLMGLMETLVSDRGPEMRAKIVAELCAVLGVNHKFTSIYAPKCNATVERLNSSLKRTIKKVCEGNVKDWHLFLNLCCLAYNTSRSSRHHFTPFYTVTGREARLPLECINDVAFTPTYTNKEQYNYALYYKVQEIWKMVQQATQKAMKSMSAYYDRSTFIVKHKLGDKVMVWRPIRAGTNFRTFMPKFKKGFTITRIVGRYTYEVTGPEGEMYVVSHDLLRPWNLNDESEEDDTQNERDTELELLAREETEDLGSRYPLTPLEWDAAADLVLTPDFA